jgi:hypothetical protein
MGKRWRCGDCGTEYPKKVHHCTRYFDDYVSLRGGSVESAIQRAVDAAIAPLMADALRKLRPQYVWTLGATILVPVRYGGGHD